MSAHAATRKRPNAVAVASVVVGVVLVAVVIFVVVVPLAVMAAAVFGLPAHPSLAAVLAILEPQNRAALFNSMTIAVAGTVVAAVVGVPAAIVVERTNVVGGRVLGALFALPLAVPPYLLAFAFRAAYDDRIGLWRWPSVVFGDIDSASGVALVLGTAFMPVVFLRVRATLQAIDGALEEAARVAGASALRALLDVTVPLVRPAVVSSLVLVFVACAAAYGVPVLLGLAADPPVVVVTARIAVALQGGGQGVNDALGLSVALAGMAGLAFAVPALMSRGVAVVTGKAHRATQLSLGRVRLLVSGVVWGIAVAVVVAPLGALMLQGVTKRAGDAVSATNLSLHHVADVLARPEVRAATLTSLGLSVAAAGIIVAVALAIVVTRRRSVGVTVGALRVTGSLMELAYALPGTVVAVALILTFAAELRLVVLDKVTFVLALGGTVAMLLVAYVVKYAALGLRAADEALDQLHPSLEEAARIAGATPMRAFIDVTLPLLRAHLVAAAVAVALPCFTELTMSVLLQAPGTNTLGVVLFSLYEYGDPQEAMALAAVLVVVMLLGQGAIIALRKPS
jgi:iron(III) transport system permease protein